MRGELIGKGTFSRVYLGLDVNTGGLLAIKEIEIPPSGSNILAAFRTEGKILGELRHRNIVRCLGYQEKESFAKMYVYCFISL